jgi:hypothetical protein
MLAFEGVHTLNGLKVTSEDYEEDKKRWFMQMLWSPSA